MTMEYLKEIAEASAEAFELTPGELLSVEQQNLILEEVWSEKEMQIERGELTFDQATTEFLRWRDDFLGASLD